MDRYSFHADNVEVEYQEDPEPAGGYGRPRLGRKSFKKKKFGADHDPRSTQGCSSGLRFESSEVLAYDPRET